MRMTSPVFDWVSRLFRDARRAAKPARRVTPRSCTRWVEVLEARDLLSSVPTIPFTISVPTTLAAQGIYVAMYGSVASPVTNSNTLDVQYSIEWDANGNAQMVTPGGSVEVEALTFTPNAEVPGTSVATVMIPDIPNGNTNLGVAANTDQLNGARLVFGVGHMPYLAVSSTGSVAAPAPSSLNDPNTAQNYDFVEFTLDQAGMHINTSTVDQFGFPITVSATPVTSIVASAGGTPVTSPTITVASTAGFASNGAFQVMVNGNIETINYGSKNATQFLQCTSTGTGTLATGQTVWSVSTYITSSGVGVDLNRQDVFNQFASYVGNSPFLTSLTDGNIASAGSIYLPALGSNPLSAHSGTAPITIQAYNVSPSDPLLQVYFGSQAVAPTSAVYDPTTKLTTITVTPPVLPDSTVDVRVGSTGGLSSMYAYADYYTFGTGGTPTVTSLQATQGPTTGGTKVLINGANFSDPNLIGANCQVLFGSTPAAFSVLTTGQILAIAPAGTAGTVNISVMINGVTAATTPAFTYVTNLPVVSSVSATNVLPGTTITIGGSNFVAGQTTVNFGAVAGTNVQVASPTSLTVTVPQGGAGTVQITVTTPSGTSPLSPDAKFTFFSLPAYSATDSLRLVNPSDILIIESNPPQTLFAKCEPGGQLTPGQNYFYQITATSNYGESAASNTQSSQANGIPGYNSIALSWTPFLNATGYNVYRSTSPTGPFQFLGHVNGGNAAAFLDDGSLSPTAQQPPANIYTYDPLASYFDSTLIAFFNHYAPVANGGDGATFNLTYGGINFTGTTVTDGTGTYLSITGSDSTSCKIYRPLFNTNTNNPAYPPPPAGLTNVNETPGQMVFSGDGVFAFNTGAHSADIENVIVAALNRGIATNFNVAPTDWGRSPSLYYTTGSVANFYAGYMHQEYVSISDDRPASLGGPQPLAYGFSYDDQAGDGGAGYGSYFTTPAAQPTVGSPVPNGSFAITVSLGSWTPQTPHNPAFQVNGSTLDVYAISTDTTFAFTAGTTSFTASVNSVSETFDFATISTINFHGTTGNDSLVFVGGTGNETATILPNTLHVTGPGYTLNGTLIKSITAHSGGGNDVAYLYAANGVSDNFIATSTFAVLGDVAGAYFTNAVYGYGTTVGVNRYPTAGTHAATLYTSTASDLFVGKPVFSELAGTGFNNVAIGYPVVNGVNSDATPGAVHTAHLYTSTASDKFIATPTLAILYGTGFNNIAHNYATVVGINLDTTPGAVHDAALIGSTTLANTFAGTSTYGQMSGTGFNIIAQQFTSVSASGGKSTDIALLIGSSASDRFIATSTYGSLAGTTFNNTAYGFGQVYMYGTPGSTAYLYSGSGNNVFYGRNNYGALYGTGYFNEALNFSTVVAISSAGSYNTVNIDSLDYTFKKIGTWH